MTHAAELRTAATRTPDTALAALLTVLADAAEYPSDAAIGLTGAVLHRALAVARQTREECLMPDTTPTTEGRCPNCNHPKHLPGTECDGGVDHGPKRWHRCLCLARPGAALSCPPQMNCQGGTLGYSDIWYLQHGHSLMTADGVVSPEALKTTPVCGTTDQQPTPPPTEPCDEHGAHCRTADWTPRGTDQQPVTAPAGTELRDHLRREFGKVLRRWGLLDEVNDPAAAEEFAVTDLLSVLPAPTDRAAAVQPADRRARYATAISRWHRDPEQPLYAQGADAVMAVADTEQAALRAEVEGLDEALRGAIAVSEKDGARLRAERDDATHDAAKHGGRYNEACATIDRLRAEVERLRTDRATVYREAADAVDRVRAIATRLEEFAENALKTGDRQLYTAIAADVRNALDQPQQPTTTPVHLPKGTNPDYPFLCPGPTEPTTTEATA